MTNGPNNSYHIIQKHDIRPNNSYHIIQKHDKRTQYLKRHDAVTSQIDPITHTTLYKNITNGPNNTNHIIQKHDKRTQ